MKHDIASHKRWNPPVSWLVTRHHPPERGEIHTVRISENGEPFKALYSYSHEWVLVEERTPGVFTTAGPRFANSETMQWLCRM